MGQNLRNASLYDDDFYGWTTKQADLLRRGCLDEADIANIVEEIETLGRSEKRELESAYRLIALHLLKMIYQPRRSSRSWLRTVVRERNTAQSVLADNPSLRSKQTELWIRAYRQARKEAAAETGLSLEVFPEEAPFDLAQAQDEAFLPLTMLEAVPGQTIDHSKPSGDDDTPTDG